MMRRRPERAVQAAFVESFRLLARPDAVLLASIPNEHPPRWLGGLLQLGMLVGMPDVMLAWKTGQVGFLEFKAERGRLTPSQRAVHAALLGLGFRLAVVRSFDQAWSVVREWQVPVRAMPAAGSGGRA